MPLNFAWLQVARIWETLLFLASWLYFSWALYKRLTPTEPLRSTSERNSKYQWSSRKQVWQDATGSVLNAARGLNRANVWIVSQAVLTWYTVQKDISFFQSTACDTVLRHPRHCIQCQRRVLSQYYRKRGYNSVKLRSTPLGKEAKTWYEHISQEMRAFAKLSEPRNSCDWLCYRCSWYVYLLNARRIVLPPPIQNFVTVS